MFLGTTGRKIGRGYGAARHFSVKNQKKFLGFVTKNDEKGKKWGWR